MAVTLNDITKYIKMNSNFPESKLNVDLSFLQPNTIPVNIVNERNCTNSPGQIVNEISYKENDIIEIPSKLNTFLDLNNYYLFGCLNLVDSILMTIDESYKLFSKTEKEEHIINFISEMRLKLDSLYKINSSFYETLKVRKNKIDQELNKGVYNLYILQLIADFKNINITVLDLNKDIYITYKSNNSNNNVILINITSKYVPLLHIYNYKFSDEDIISITSQFNNNLTLKAISNYTLKDLQTISLEYNINLTNEDLKKKTKQQLYDELNNKYTI